MSEDAVGGPIFAMRIVCIDFYMASPLPDLDLGFSALSGSSLPQVPVIRIFGSTPAGQKTCLHVHKVRGLLLFPRSCMPWHVPQWSRQGNMFLF